jgi:arginine repressor
VFPRVEAANSGSHKSVFLSGDSQKCADNKHAELITLHTLDRDFHHKLSKLLEEIRALKTNTGQETQMQFYAVVAAQPTSLNGSESQTSKARYVNRTQSVDMRGLRTSEGCTELDDIED